MGKTVKLVPQMRRDESRTYIPSEFLQGSGYTALRQVGRGGNSEVWSVQHRADKTLAIAKLLRPGVDSAQAVAHESTLLASLPVGISPTLRWWKSKPRYPCLIMDVAGGCPIEQKDAKPETLCSLLNAVDAIHSSGIVHADLKPSHIFIDQNFVQIIDFGAAGFVGTRKSTDLTPAFSAPELYRGEIPSFASDVYSLAAIFYLLYAKRPLFTGGQRLLAEAHCNWEPPQLSEFAPVSDAINRILHRALDKDPLNRPRVQELIEVFSTPLSSQVSRKRRILQIADLPSQRLLLLALSPRPPLDELQNSARAFGATIRTWTDSHALLSLPLHDRDARSKLEKLADSLAHPERRIQLDERNFKTRINRRGEKVELVDGEALLEEYFQHSHERGIVRSGQLRYQPALHPTLVGRNGLLENLKSLLCDTSESMMIVELLSPPGSGATRIVGELLETIPEAVAFSANAIGSSILIVDDADGISQADITRIRSAMDDASLRSMLLVYRQSGLTAASQGFVCSARLHLDPLSPEDSHTLFSELLPEAANWTDEQRRYTFRWTGGLCKLIVEAADAAHKGGFVSERATGKAHFADMAALDQILRSASMDWVLKQHESQLQGPGLEVAKELCLRQRQTIAELQMGRWNIASTEQRLALHKGLELLDSHGLLASEADGRVGLRSELLRRAIYGQHPEKYWRVVHRVRLQHWLRQADSPIRNEAMAHHGQHCGRHALAIEANRKIARHCMREGECSAAEAAIERNLTMSPKSTHSVLLRSRAEVRMRSDRLGSALQDAHAAASIATSDTDEKLALLMAAMICDWMRDYDQASALLTRASANVRKPSVELCSHLLLAAGRSAFRSGDMRIALRFLHRVRTTKSGLPRRIALFLAPLATLGLGQPALASSELTIALQTCEREEDWLHLCAALGNQSIVWSALGKPEFGQLDMRKLIRLARKTGHAAPERVAAYNLAEDLFWMGQDDEALALARRARSLYSEFEVHRTSIYSLLLVRILVSLGQDEDAGNILSSCVFHQNIDFNALSQVLRMYLNMPNTHAVDKKESLSHEIRLEVAYWEAHAAFKDGRMNAAKQALKQARCYLSLTPLFVPRFQRLENSLLEYSRIHH